MQQKIIKTTCTRDYPNTCGLLAVVENDRAIKLIGNKEHPISEGRTCIKCTHYLERVYHKERVLHPLKKVDGKFKRISWDEALDEIANRIKEICRVKTPESILYYIMRPELMYKRSIAGRNLFLR
ncbi:MAG: molybdopterin-dependent oxidoreductase [Clostridium sp.]|uniref:molybdopterin-dependent oxidoreductase n=1 Tax=Clostridium sp. TaxID=1506 RepID=UPI0039ED03A7